MKNGKKKDAQKKTQKRKVGRPSKYPFNVTLEQIELITMLGATDTQMSEILGISEATLNNYKRDHPEFLEAIKKGKREADARVIKSLFERACGYEHPEEKIFCSEGKIVRADTIKHYPPEVAAIVWWTKNRCGWKEQPDEELENRPPVVYITRAKKKED